MRRFEHFYGLTYSVVCSCIRAACLFSGALEFGDLPDPGLRL